MKPRVFIGSSTEGLSVAKSVKSLLSDIADCQIWNESFFRQNRSSFESLIEGSILFDFAVLIATRDDVQLKRDNLQNIARDNIIFEFGLYAGRLGIDRALLLKEKGLDLPSDLFGISLPEFTNDPASGGKLLKDVLGDVISHIEEYSKLYQLSFIPSTAIAVGYFENFVSRVCRELMEANKRSVNNKDYNEFLLHVVIPDELPDNMHDQLLSYLSNRKLTQMKVDTNTRSYSFYLNFLDAENEVLELYDMPTTLSALKRSIEMAIPKTYVGESERERILKKKEMNNFHKTLLELITNNQITRNRVVVEFIDVKG
jgi:hypothetical protein